MRTDRSRTIRVLCLLCALAISLCLTGCSSGKEDASPVPVTASEPSGYTTAHFSAFELLVPENWSQRGNVGKLYEGDGMFLLAGPFEAGDDPLASLEQTLAEELQLFFNTEYYLSQTRFQYEKEGSSLPLRQLKGTLFNDRNGTSLRFAGAFDADCGSYYVYFWQEPSDDSAGDRRAEVTYESYHTL